MNDDANTDAKADVIVTHNSWRSLRQHTDARIGLGRTGVSLPTREQLAFQLDHARARDAVHLPLDEEALQQQLEADGFQVYRLSSRVSHRQEYLQRPDFGRRLSPASVSYLQQQATQITPPDTLIVIADGLSSTAVASHAVPMVRRLGAALNAEGLRPGPVCLVSQGRVAVGDEVGELLKARSVILLIGERPGLSSPDSLGIYYTYAPRVGLTDAARNCISNIRPPGLSYDDATDKLMFLLLESYRRQLSGVQLKDTSVRSEQTGLGEQRNNFLLPDKR
ncbi:ethanolamine ammonia-lyase subunit EutC [Nitrincola iocasae]|uniref:Ethanolamine ammonia-lyase small subunit n=1 Tax=Nitrincola iocasae TaxID=2614693 RepID=A0A5J6LDS4_9GAMM|nr:ethanolamine ammonia-lyase subunit EutC [Nitrincola iocasae]QEW06478.1 ethanolamine ammonia-lyase subunit EutC [Nitrincola iocasae]